MAIAVPMLILAIALGNVQGLGFLMAQGYRVPDHDGAGPLEASAVTIRNVEQLADPDFFPHMPADRQGAIKPRGLMTGTVGWIRIDQFVSLTERLMAGSG